MGRGEPQQPIVGVTWGGPTVLKKRVDNAILIGVPLLGSIAAIVHILANGLSWIAASSFLIFYVLVGIGVALGMHRLFTHQSFETTGALRFVLGALATMSFQGTILRWVTDHRRHHAHTDVHGDVHSPHVDPWGQSRQGAAGFWFAHVGWMFDDTATDPRVFGRDLLADPLVMFLSRTHWCWLGLSLALPYAYGWALGGSAAALEALLVGGFLRTAVLHNVVWAVNSVGHSHGVESFPQGNKSKNNLILALLTFGDGWHNNHHRFPRSAFHGLRPSEIDVNGWLISLLEKCGLAWDVVRIPTRRLESARTAQISGA